MKQKIILLPLILLGLLLCYPVLFLLAGSLMEQAELTMHLKVALKGEMGFVDWSLLPLSPTLRHYVCLLLDSPEYFVMFWNSVKLVFGILAGQMLTGTAAAWGFAKYEFPFKKTLFTIYILLMVMPFQVTMLSSYLVLNHMKLIDTSLAVILSCAWSTFPVFIMYRFYCFVPDSLLEAAKIDGAGEVSVFLHIGLPLGSTGIISALVLGFLEYWNLVEQPLAFLKTKALWPLSLYLPNIGMEQLGISFAASIVTLLPAFLVFLCGQDYLEKGIIASALKE